tara:strand:- start:78 stop:518 length:441 start_codon:yes stop_codon:yes gene_type:complete
MKYAILDDAKTSVTKTGTIHELFSNVSFPRSGVPASFLTDNNTVELIQTLSYTSPSQKLSKVDAYVDSGKAYSVKVEATSTEEVATLTAEKWVEIRQDRDWKLQKTDWRASSDLTLSDAWKNYRQALRDIPTQASPFAITWPTEPS